MTQEINPDNGIITAPVGKEVKAKALKLAEKDNRTLTNYIQWLIERESQNITEGS